MVFQRVGDNLKVFVFIGHVRISRQKVVFLYVIPGFVAFLQILFVLSVLATVWEKKRKSAEASKVEDIPNQQPLCPKITDAAEVKTPENRKQINGTLLKN